MRRIVLVVLVGCKSAPPLPPERDDLPERSPQATTATEAKPAPAGFATADLVAITDGDLTTYETHGGTLTHTGAVTLVENLDGNAVMWGFGFGHWATRDHLFLRVAERAVVHVSAAGIEPVALPPRDAFKTPKPSGSDDLVPGDWSVPHGGLAVTKGEAWWSECPWGFPADGFQCSSYVSARLWPTPTLVAGSAISNREYAWPKTVPAGYVTREVKRGEYAVGGVTCEPPRGQGAKHTIFAAPQDEEVMSWHWVSNEPARLLVIYGSPGYAFVIPTRWSLHAGCSRDPIAGGVSATPGPGGLWLAGEGTDRVTDYVVYRGADPIGKLPGDAIVWFRPLE